MMMMMMMMMMIRHANALVKDSLSKGVYSLQVTVL